MSAAKLIFQTTPNNHGIHCRVYQEGNLFVMRSYWPNSAGKVYQRKACQIIKNDRLSAIEHALMNAHAFVSVERLREVGGKVS